MEIRPSFCDRVREKVPEERQRDAPPEIAKPVMEAFAKTSDDSPLMSMFEELMARAIDINEAEKLSPNFPAIIESLSPLQAKLIKSLSTRQHYTDVMLDHKQNLIVQRFNANFDINEFGGIDHHLTLVQDLEKKNLTTSLNLDVEREKDYPNIVVPPHHRLVRMTVRLTMFGKWFAQSCIHDPGRPPQPSQGVPQGGPDNLF
jgi:hypothetical protein